LVQFLNEDRPPLTQILDHELVVHHFVTHIDRRAEHFQSAVDDFDGAVDAGAEASGIGELDLHGDYLDARGTRDGTNMTAGGELSAHPTGLRRIGEARSTLRACAASVGADLSPACTIAVKRASTIFRRFGRR